MNRMNVSDKIELEELIIPFGEPDGANERRAAVLQFPKDLTREEIQHILSVTGWGAPGITLELAVKWPTPKELVERGVRKGLAGADAEQDHYHKTQPPQDDQVLQDKMEDGR